MHHLFQSGVINSRTVDHCVAWVLWQERVACVLLVCDLGDSHFYLCAIWVIRVSTCACVVSPLWRHKVGMVDNLRFPDLAVSSTAVS